MGVPVCSPSVQRWVTRTDTPESNYLTLTSALDSTGQSKREDSKPNLDSRPSRSRESSPSTLCPTI